MLFVRYKLRICIVLNFSYFLESMLFPQLGVIIQISSRVNLNRNWLQLSSHWIHLWSTPNFPIPNHSHLLTLTKFEVGRIWAAEFQMFWFSVPLQSTPARFHNSRTIIIFRTTLFSKPFNPSSIATTRQKSG